MQGSSGNTMQFLTYFFFSFLWFGVTNVFLIARKSLNGVDFKGNFFFPFSFSTLGTCRWVICLSYFNNVLFHNSILLKYCDGYAIE